jgi:predicted phosphodiesterase
MPKRKAENYFNLGRNLYQNHYRAEAGKSEFKPSEERAHFKVSDLFENKIFSWLKHYLKSRFGSKHPYMSYDTQGGDNGIYKMEKTSADVTPGVKVILAGDWATDTPDSDRIGRIMGDHQPDYTIHLGDTYFVGAKFEMSNNFLDPASSWPRGSSGSFALLGNHEMYARGVSYYRDLLPTLGIKKQGSDKYESQKASYFCLENEHWRLIGIDTGYNSIGKIPIIENLPFFGADCRLPDEMIKWLKNVVKPAYDNRGLIFLSHHQYYSAFESDYKKPAKQLAAVIGSERKVLWFWGHEHRFAIYGLNRSEGGVNAFGRCVGHGGMPIELKIRPNQDKAKENNLVLFDMRVREEIEGEEIGHNGFVVLKFIDNRMEADYYDEENLMLTEVWECDNFSGKITGKIIRHDLNMEKKLSQFGTELNKAVGE